MSSTRLSSTGFGLQNGPVQPLKPPRGWILGASSPLGSKSLEGSPVQTMKPIRKKVHQLRGVVGHGNLLTFLQVPHKSSEAYIVSACKTVHTASTLCYMCAQEPFVFFRVPFTIKQLWVLHFHSEKLSYTYTPDTHSPPLPFHIEASRMRQCCAC